MYSISTLLESQYLLWPRESSGSNAVAVLSTKILGVALSWNSASCHGNELQLGYLLDDEIMWPRHPVARPMASSQLTWQLAIVQLSPALMANLQNHQQRKTVVASSHQVWSWLVIQKYLNKTRLALAKESLCYLEILKGLLYSLLKVSPFCFSHLYTIINLELIFFCIR